LLRSVETQPSDSKICSLQTNRSSSSSSMSCHALPVVFIVFKVRVAGFLHFANFALPVTVTSRYRLSSNLISYKVLTGNSVISYLFCHLSKYCISRMFSYVHDMSYSGCRSYIQEVLTSRSREHGKTATETDNAPVCRSRVSVSFVG
jgi:hypothetical protein